MLPAFSLLIARLLANSEKITTLTSELVLPLCFCAVGLFLILMPSMAVFAKLSWVQSMDFVWGGAVLIIGLALLGLTLYLRHLSILAVSTSVVFAIVIGFYCFFNYTGLAYNLKPAAEKIKYLQVHDIPVAYVGKYQGQFHFLGRLTQAIEVVANKHAISWANTHPDGYLIFLVEKKDTNVSYIQRQRERWLIARTERQTMQGQKSRADD